MLPAVLAASLLSACAEAMPPPEVGGRATKGQEPTARAAAGVRLAEVGSFSAPLLVTSPPGDRARIFVAEQGGRVMVVKNGRKLGRPFLDISGRVLHEGEQGLLGLAFAPDYSRSGRFYVYYTARDGETNEIREFRRATAERAAQGSGRRVLAMPNLEPNHNGGHIVFGPDGLLYVGTGDGGGGNDEHGERGNAQDLGSLLGKILRIDPRRANGRPYTVPASNPFVGRSGARGEVYAYGLRNPWRFSFDRKTDALTIADVGQDEVEEVNHSPGDTARGANYGWRPFEGNNRIYDEPAPGAVTPVITHNHASGFCSITGGVIVRDPGLPALRGRYVYGDVCQDRLWTARLSPGRARDVRRVGTARVGSVVSFGEDARGRVYVASLEGPVYRLVSR